MKPAPFPENEPERLKALTEYNLLDTLPEEVYDDITRLASEICRTPISIISLIDRDRQWNKSTHRLKADGVPRELSFCAHVIVDPSETFIVTDARLDERFADNPMTTGQPHVIFYAGVPLVNPDGYALGSLCVVDHRPRTLTDNQLLSLRALARLVMTHFELRKAKAELENTLNKLNAVDQTPAVADLALQIQPLTQSLQKTVESLANKYPRPDQLDELLTLRQIGLELNQTVKPS